ncbi:MAG: hypothetical protein WC477_03050 [Patescibacteria group bacterium]
MQTENPLPENVLPPASARVISSIPQPPIVKTVIEAVVALRQKIDAIHGGLRCLTVITNGSFPVHQDEDSMHVWFVEATGAKRTLDAYGYIERMFPWLFGQDQRPAGDCYFFTYWHERDRLQLRVWVSTPAYLINIPWLEALDTWIVNGVRKLAEQKEILDADAYQQLERITQLFAEQCRELLSPSNLLAASDSPTPAA